MPAEVPGDPDDLAYADAVAELEEILAELDSDDVDVDQLATQVQRAAALIASCRRRLAAARLDVTRIVADLDTLDDAEPAPETQADAGPADDEGTEA